jgi:hypothetical protein
MYRQSAPLSIDARAAGCADSILPVYSRIGTGGPGSWRPSPRHWTDARSRASLRAAGELVTAVVTNSTGTRWNGFPAARDFG